MMTAKWTTGSRSLPSNGWPHSNSSANPTIPMPTLHNDFADFLRLLNERNVRYLVVGGYAVAYHGYPRYTGDLDVFVEASPENAARLVEVYGEFGFNRSDLKPEIFMIPDNVVRIGHEPVRLEVLTSITGVAFADAYVRRIQVEMNGLVVPFIALVDLIKNKTSTGRGKDRVDAEALQKRANPPSDEPVQFL